MVTLEQRIDTLEEQQEESRERFDRVDRRFDRIDTTLRKLDRHITDMGIRQDRFRDMIFMLLRHLGNPEALQEALDLYRDDPPTTA